MLLENNKKYTRKIRALAKRQRAVNAERLGTQCDLKAVAREEASISAAAMRISDEFAAELLAAGAERDGIAVSATLLVWEDIDEENDKFIQKAQKK